MFSVCNPPQDSQTRHTPRQGTGRTQVLFVLVTKQGAGRAAEPWSTRLVPCQGVHVEHLLWHHREVWGNPSLLPKSEHVCSKGDGDTSSEISGCHGTKGQRPHYSPGPPRVACHEAVTIKVMLARPVARTEGNTHTAPWPEPAPALPAVAAGAGEGRRGSEPEQPGLACAPSPGPSSVEEKTRKDTMRASPSGNRAEEKPTGEPGGTESHKEPS